MAAFRAEQSKQKIEIKRQACLVDENKRNDTTAAVRLPTHLLISSSPYSEPSTTYTSCYYLDAYY